MTFKNFPERSIDLVFFHQWLQSVRSHSKYFDMHHLMGFHIPIMQQNHKLSNRKHSCKTDLISASSSAFCLFEQIIQSSSSFIDLKVCFQSPEMEWWILTLSHHFRCSKILFFDQLWLNQSNRFDSGDLLPIENLGSGVEGLMSPSKSFTLSSIWNPWIDAET